MARTDRASVAVVRAQTLDHLGDCECPTLALGSMLDRTRMFAPSPEELQFKLLDPLARRRGLDYAQELLEPQASAAQSAFRFVSCGADLLLSMSYPDGFPAVSKRTRKRGAKAL